MLCNTKPIGSTIISTGALDKFDAVKIHIYFECQWYRLKHGQFVSITLCGTKSPKYWPVSVCLSVSVCVYRYVWVWGFFLRLISAGRSTGTDFVRRNEAAGPIYQRTDGIPPVSVDTCTPRPCRYLLTAPGRMRWGGNTTERKCLPGGVSYNEMIRRRQIKRQHSRWHNAASTRPSKTLTRSTVHTLLQARML